MVTVTGNSARPDSPGVPSATRPTSIRDVARVAKVSHQTVSRVINEHPNVSDATRARVALAIATLGFRPSTAAQALARGATQAVTVLTSNTSLYGYASTISGIEEAARASGTRVAISVLESDDPEVIEAAAAGVSDPRAGAVIVLAYDKAGADVLSALPSSIRSSAVVEPCVGRNLGPSERPRWTWFDDVVAARRATEHLLALGHRTVQHIAIPSSISINDRQLGWERALRAAAIAIPPVVHLADWHTAAAHAAALNLLQDRRVTAVLCGNDDQALGVIRAAYDLGRRVPEDVSVIGFDDVPAAAYYTPSLTTIRFDFAALGRRAFQLLGGGGTEVHVPEPILVVRESSGPPPR